MKILVAVTEVAIVDDQFEIDGQDVDDRYLSYDLNEWDDYAIEAAVQLQEAADDVEVVTVTIGPERAEETVRQALAKGADRAVRVWDDELADLTVLDPSLKAGLLAAVAEEESPDLVLTGVQSGDGVFGATGVTLANRLDYGWAAVVTELDIDTAAGVASVHRELEGGVEEVTDVELPAVLTIQTGINEPRYASLRGIRQAQSKPLDVRSPDDLGIDGIENTQRIVDMYKPESEEQAEIWDGSTEKTAAKLTTVLEEEGVVGR